VSGAVADPGGDDTAALDNPIYASLTSVHARFAERHGRALRYTADVAPFLALAPGSAAEDWADAVELLPPGAFAGTIDDGSPLPPQLRVAQRFEIVQMVGTRARGAADPDALTLGAADVAEMLELVRATEPGPFFERTVELGRYVGLRSDGVLVAMAGERMHLDGWTEISAVCTAAAHRGRGLASRLIGTLVADIHARSEGVFLHVLTSNTTAIALYEGLGFDVRERSAMLVLTRA